MDSDLVLIKAVFFFVVKKSLIEVHLIPSSYFLCCDFGPSSHPLTRGEKKAE